MAVVIHTIRVEKMVISVDTMVIVCSFNEEVVKMLKIYFY